MTKRCTVCGHEKPLSQFSPDKRKKDGFRAECKQCGREQARAYYRRNPGPFKRRAKASRNRLREFLLQVADRIKAARGCALCGDSTLCVLDFHHHTEPGQPVTRATQSYAAFQKELKKCVVLCANCHRKVHAGLLTVQDDMLCDAEIPRLPRNPSPDRKPPARNRPTNKLLTWRNRTRPLVAWAEELKVDPNTLAMRLSFGWTIDKTLSMPVRVYRKKEQT